MEYICVCWKARFLYSMPMCANVIVWVRDCLIWAMYVMFHLFLSIYAWIGLIFGRCSPHLIMSHMCIHAYAHAWWFLLFPILRLFFFRHINVDCSHCIVNQANIKCGESHFYTHWQQNALCSFSQIYAYFVRICCVAHVVGYLSLHRWVGLLCVCVRVRIFPSY